MRITHHRAPRTLALRALPLLMAACAGHGGMPDTGGTAGHPVPVQCGRGNGAGSLQRIGMTGDTVGVDGHTLKVPRGALERLVDVSILEVASSSIRVELGPDGTTFDRPATLTLSYARCRGFPRGFSDLHILQVDGNDSVIAVLPSTVDRRHRTVSAPLEHLSGYLIGGNRDGGT